jgi:hypothetical protein
MTNFIPFPKVPRLSRECIITEKIDGTNASVYVVNENLMDIEGWPKDKAMAPHDGHFLFAGSRKRFITPDEDNFGFARWALHHSEELITCLGPGSHFGEWWGSGIQRGYGLEKGEKRFSLFNTGRWAKENTPKCCHVVPILFTGAFTTPAIDHALCSLKATGSAAAPGFFNPEGIIIYHTAANQMFKKTFEGDDHGKEYGA